MTLKNVFLDHFVLILKECECKEESHVLAPSTLGSLSYLLVACTELFLKVVTSERVIIIQSIFAHFLVLFASPRSSESQ